jgi:hypothetical protein
MKTLITIGIAAIWLIVIVIAGLLGMAVVLWDEACRRRSVESPESSIERHPRPSPLDGARRCFPAILLLFLFSGCATSTGYINKSKVFLRPTVASIGAGVLFASKTPEERVTRANYLYAAGTAVRSLSGGSAAPSVEELQAALNGFAPQSSDDDWAQLIASISSLYSSVRPGIPPDTLAVLDALEQVAMGFEDAARPYVKKAGG